VTAGEQRRVSDGSVQLVKRDVDSDQHHHQAATAALSGDRLPLQGELRHDPVNSMSSAATATTRQNKARGMHFTLQLCKHNCCLLVKREFRPIR